MYAYNYTFLENYFVETDFEEAEFKRFQKSFSYFAYGTIIADITHLNNAIFIYSATVVFSNDSSSDSCVVMFTDNLGYLTATTKIVNRYVGTLVYIYM